MVTLKQSDYEHECVYTALTSKNVLLLILTFHTDTTMLHPGLVRHFVSILIFVHSFAIRQTQ